jgi:hypothetical protein
MEKGMLKAFTAGRLAPNDYEKIWGLLKKTMPGYGDGLSLMLC